MAVASRLDLHQPNKQVRRHGCPRSRPSKTVQRSQPGSLRRLLYSQNKFLENMGAVQGGITVILYLQSSPNLLDSSNSSIFAPELESETMGLMGSDQMRCEHVNLGTWEWEPGAEFGAARIIRHSPFLAPPSLDANRA